MGKKRNVKKGEKGKKMDLTIWYHLHFCCFFCFFDLLFFCFYFVFFCFFLLFAWKKAKKKQNKGKKKQIEKTKKSNKNANGQVHFFPIFPPFCLSFFSLLFCFCVFWILLICFLVSPFFLHFSRFFSSFKKIRISYGLVNIILMVFLYDSQGLARSVSARPVVTVSRWQGRGSPVFVELRAGFKIPRGFHLPILN